MMVISMAEETLDPRIRRTRGYIREAFRQLLEEKSFKSITVREITERAEVNRATFYAHYEDKYALLHEALQAIFQEELEQRALNVCQYSEANLRALMITVCEFIRDTGSNCKTVDSQFELIVERQVRNEVKALLMHWLDKLGISGDLKSLAVATSWTIYGLAEQWNLDASKETAEDYTDRVLPLILGYLPG
ncbi:MAG: TetR/AcrR family transcriptional regulator [Anaerolineaceae bacterium]|nr:TetR/AcrR family transcriptional regulator [Anaerolineaceae bacterium]